MKLAVNGKIPSKEELELLSHAVPASFNLGSWSYYEENIEWEHMEITYPNGDVLRCASYTGLWELITLSDRWEMCSVELKMAILSELFSHLLWFYDEEESGGIEEIELFVEGQDPHPETTAYFDKLFAENPPYPDEKK
ncbi:hypothetical protein D3C87_1094610 [compost metagenome]